MCDSVISEQDEGLEEVVEDWLTPNTQKHSTGSWIAASTAVDQLGSESRAAVSM